MAQIEATINFTAVVVVYNEADRLREALDSIGFCKEFIVVDLGSTDDSMKIAAEYGAVILTHERPAYPNIPRQFGIRHASHEWIVTIDPDETFPTDELPKIEKLIRDHAGLAGVRMPWQFYFGGRELNCTAWGNPGNKKVSIVHRDRIKTTPYVHIEYEIDDNVYTFQRGDIQPIKHYWMRNYREFIHKHWRYQKHEGEKAYTAGKRFTWRSGLSEMGSSLRKDLFKFKAIRSPRGILLSLFHLWYVAASQWQLRKYQRGQQRTQRA